MKELTPQILAMYLGCEIYFEQCSYRFVHSLDISKGEKHKLTPLLFSEITNDSGLKLRYKPILRKLSDMTGEEGKEFNLIMNGYNDQSKQIEEVEAAKMLYLLSKHFDLFGLIEKGLALDAKKVKE